MDIHFIRPEWLLLLPVVLVLFILHIRQSRAAGWHGIINVQARRELSIGENQSILSYIVYLLLPLCLACVAMAGPTWQKQSHSLGSARQAAVFVLDLSPSMLAKDVKPDRLTRARLKLHDMLAERSAIESALIVYSGNAFRVVPFTDDPNTIQSLLPILNPEIMPTSGSNVEDALTLAIDMFHDADLTEGNIVLISDGIHSDALQQLHEQITDSFRLSILGVGTVTGSTIPVDTQTVLLDEHNKPVIARVNIEQMQQLTDKAGGVFTPLTSDSTDVERLTAALTEPFSFWKRDTTSTTEQWHDEGYWLVLAMLPLVAFAFRHLRLFLSVQILVPSIFFTTALTLPTDSRASDWFDWWLSDDRQAMKLLQAGDAATASQRFENEDWRLVALYRNGDYQKVVNALSKPSTPRMWFLLGNTYVHLGQYRQATAAYQKVVILSADELNQLTLDARYNLSLLENRLDSEQDRQDGNNPTNPAQDESDTAPTGEENQASSANTAPSNQIGGALGGSDSLNQRATTEQNGVEGEPVNGEVDELANDATPTTSATDEDRSFERQMTTTETLLLESDRKVLNPYSEQWLRSLPQDPGGYFRRKMAYQAQLKNKGIDSDVPAESARY